MKEHSFNEVNSLDTDLYQLAFYDVTQGRLFIPKSMEDIANLHERVAKRFNYFKTTIQRGSCTFDFIQQRVLSSNGPFFQKQINPDDKDFMDNLTACLDEEELERKREKKRRREMKKIDKSTRNIIDLLESRFLSDMNGDACNNDDERNERNERNEQ